MTTSLPAQTVPHCSVVASANPSEKNILCIVLLQSLSVYLLATHIVGSHGQEYSLIDRQVSVRSVTPAQAETASFASSVLSLVP